MESYYTSLDDFQQTNNKSTNISLDTTIRCCDNIDNYMPCEEHTLCRICNQPITVLNSNPEKCYDGGKQTSRVGMPSSELLPDSTSGSVIINKFTSNPNIGLATNITINQSLLKNLSTYSIKFCINSSSTITCYFTYFSWSNTNRLCYRAKSINIRNFTIRDNFIFFSKFL